MGQLIKIPPRFKWDMFVDEDSESGVTFFSKTCSKEAKFSLCYNKMICLKTGLVIYEHTVYKYFDKKRNGVLSFNFDSDMSKQCMYILNAKGPDKLKQVIEGKDKWNL